MIIPSFGPEWEERLDGSLSATYLYAVVSQSERLIDDGKMGVVEFIYEENSPITFIVKTE